MLRYAYKKHTIYTGYHHSAVLRTRVRREAGNKLITYGILNDETLSIMGIRNYLEQQPGMERPQYWIIMQSSTIRGSCFTKFRMLIHIILCTIKAVTLSNGEYCIANTFSGDAGSQRFSRHKIRMRIRTNYPEHFEILHAVAQVVAGCLHTTTNRHMLRTDYSTPTIKTRSPNKFRKP